MTQKVEDRALVIPGECVFEGMDYLPGSGVFRDGEQILSKHLGLVVFGTNRVIKVIPLNGQYIPKEGDYVIGEVTRVAYSSWNVELNSPYEGILPLSAASDQFIELGNKDISSIYDLGDLLIVKIGRVSKNKDVQVSMKDRRARRLQDGMVVSIPHTKVPRVIGKKGTMINILKDYTGSTIIVGQNGRIWLKNGNIPLAAKAIQKIAEEAHTQGLTDRINAMMEKEGKKQTVEVREDGNEE